jgi:O-antigen biosynthesis protein
VVTLSVYTPSHNVRWLDECWASLKSQTRQDFEWIVVLNQGARWACDDPRVKVSICDELRGVGAAKHSACALATGDVLIELDHDDILATDALSRIAAEFDADPDVGFVYSDGAQILEDGSKDTSTWDVRNGWVYYDEKVDGRGVLCVEALEPSPANLSFVWWAPNHVRAFRRSVYESVGGYDADRDVLDDQDLMCRLFQATEFRRIPLCLYLQRVHQSQTQVQAALNARIQVETVGMHDRYIEPMALAWAKRKGLACLDLGGAHAKPAGYLSVDLVEGADLCGDIFDVLGAMADSSVGVIRAVDLLEHIADSVRLFNEMYRVMAHGGMLLSSTPSSDGRGAFQAPDHVSYLNEHSFWYYSDLAYAVYVPAIQCRFQVSRLVTYFPSEWHQQVNISYVQADLIAIKDGPRQGGYLKI